MNSNDNSHLVTVPPGMVLSDSLFGTPIFQEDGGAGYGGGAGVAAGGEGAQFFSGTFCSFLLKCKVAKVRISSSRGLFSLVCLRSQRLPFE